MFCIVTDGDAREYVIPDNKRKEWYDMVDKYDVDAIILCEWADPIGGSTSLVKFPSYEIRDYNG